jgi:hypothetical protein
MPKFQTRHYEAIADLLSAIRADSDVHGDLFMAEACERFQEHATRLFSRDNPRFKAERFNAAARRQS